MLGAEDRAEEEEDPTPGDGFQPKAKQELEGWVRFLQQDIWWLIGQVEELQQMLAGSVFGEGIIQRRFLLTGQ